MGYNYILNILKYFYQNDQKNTDLKQFDNSTRINFTLYL